MGQQWHDLYSLLKRELASSLFLDRFATVPNFVETRNVLKDNIWPLRCFGTSGLLERLWKAYDVLCLSGNVTGALFHPTDEEMYIAELSNDPESLCVEMESIVPMFLILSKVSIFTIRPQSASHT